MTWKGWENYVPPTSAPVDPLRPSKRQKYGAVKTTVDGITFDSKREAARYIALKASRDAGEITHLELQPQFPIVVAGPDGTMVTVAKWVGDFRYRRNGEVVVEDAKGMKTDVYRLKKKIVEAQYGITIVET